MTNTKICTYETFKKFVHIRDWNKKINCDGSVDKKTIFKFIANITVNCLDMVAGGQTREDAERKLWMQIPVKWKEEFPKFLFPKKIIERKRIIIGDWEKNLICDNK